MSSSGVDETNGCGAAGTWVQLGTWWASIIPFVDKFDETAMFPVACDSMAKAARVVGKGMLVMFRLVCRMGLPRVWASQGAVPMHSIAP